MKKQIIIVSLLTLCLAGCSALNNKYLAENRYLNAKETPALKVPKSLKASTQLTPMYNVPDGAKASAAEPKISPFPPRIVP